MNPVLSEECSPRSTRGKYPPLPGLAGRRGWGQLCQAAMQHPSALGDGEDGGGGCLGAGLSRAELSLQGIVFHGGCRFGVGVPCLCGALL